jgi:hypothetical protein
MKVFINGFWDGFKDKNDPLTFDFFKKLFEKVFDTEIELGDLENSEILFESVFSKETYLYYKKWKYSFYFNGESTKRLLNEFFKGNTKRINGLGDYTLLLTCKINKKPKIINLPLFIPYIYCNNFIDRLEKQTNVTSVPSKNICAIISNGNCLERNYIMNCIERYVKIDYAGSYKNNVPKVEGAYNSQSLFDFYSQYKFVICMENTWQETYITEKIVNGFLANTIPIYWGTNKVFDYFNKDRFIYIENTNNESIVNVIKQIGFLMKNSDKYLEMVNKPIFRDGFLNRTIDDIASDMKEFLL